MVAEALWEAAHERLEGTRRAYLRGTEGRLWGAPRTAKKSRYLLTGLTHCGECGGTMEVRSRDMGQRRRYFYACTSYHRRGASVCRNLLELPLHVSDTLVLDAIEEEVLCPDVIDAALREALDVLRRPAAAHPEHEAALKEELRGLEG